MNDYLYLILQWYYNQFGKDWKQTNSVIIKTLDNPGWYLKINLIETTMQYKNFETIDINRSEHNWIYCSVEDKTFKGYGGPFNLPEILQIFYFWIEQNKDD